MMTSEDLIIQLETILKNQFSPTRLLIIDESHQHIGHTGHGGAKHLLIQIQCSILSGLSRVAAHRAIYQALSDFIPNEIHALRIQLS